MTSNEILAKLESMPPGTSIEIDYCKSGAKPWLVAVIEDGGALAGQSREGWGKTLHEAFEALFPDEAYE